MKIFSLRGWLICAVSGTALLLLTHPPLARVGGMASAQNGSGEREPPKPASRKRQSKIKTGSKVNERNKNTASSEKDVLSHSVNAVNGLAFEYARNGSEWLEVLAATSKGLYRNYDLSKPWEKLSWDAGWDQRTTCVSTSLKDPDIWVGTITSGVLVSSDAGQTWRQVRGIPTTAPIRAIAQDRQRPEMIYVGTTETLYVSHDGGAHWLRRGGSLPVGDYASIVISTLDGDRIFVGNASRNQSGGSIALKSGGVYWSTDAGMNWERIDARNAQSYTDSISSLAITEASETLYVGTRNYGIFKISKDDGHRGFSTTHQGDDNLEVLFIYPDRERPSSIYAGTYNKAKDKAFFLVSYDGGKTWRPSMIGLNTPVSISFNALSQDPRDGNVLYLGTNRGVYRSLDRGVSWSRVHEIAPDS